MSFPVTLLSSRFLLVPCRKISYRYLLLTRNQRTNHTRYIHRSERLSEEELGPTKFSTSQASILKNSFSMHDDSRPPLYQAFSIFASFAVFLIYFCILREENDLDIELGETFDRLEEEQLKQYIDSCKVKRVPCKQYEEKLLKLQEKRKSKVESVL